MEAFLKVVGHEFCDITLMLDGKEIQAHKVRFINFRFGFRFHTKHYSKRIFKMPNAVTTP